MKTVRRSFVTNSVTREFYILEKLFSENPVADNLQYIFYTKHNTTLLYPLYTRIIIKGRKLKSAYSQTRQSSQLCMGKWDAIMP